VTVRIGKVYNPQIIGNFSLSTDIYLRQRQLVAEPDQEITIFLAEASPINSQLMKMFQRKLPIVSDPLLLYIYDNVPEFAASSHYLPQLTNYSNEYELFTKTRATLAFTEEEIRYGYSLLAQLGITCSDWFVCLFSREAAFKKWQYPGLNYIAEDIHRNSDINTFSDAIELILGQGGIVVRMGSIVTQELTYKHPRVIDYPHSGIRS